jgi:hypothetical protein
MIIQTNKKIIITMAIIIGKEEICKIFIIKSAMKISRMKLAEHVVLIEEMKNDNKIVVRRSEGKRLLVPTWYVCEDNGA